MKRNRKSRTLGCSFLLFFFLPFFFIFCTHCLPRWSIGEIGDDSCEPPVCGLLLSTISCYMYFLLLKLLKGDTKAEILAWVHRALNIDMKIFFVPLEWIDKNLIWFDLFQRSHSFFKLILRIFFGYILHIFGSEFLSRNQLVSYFSPKAWIFVFRSLCGFATCSSTPK